MCCELFNSGVPRPGCRSNKQFHIAVVTVIYISDSFGMFHLENSPLCPLYRMDVWVEERLYTWLFKVTKLDFEMSNAMLWPSHVCVTVVIEIKVNNIFVLCEKTWKLPAGKLLRLRLQHKNWTMCLSFTVPCIDSFLLFIWFLFDPAFFYVLNPTGRVYKQNTTGHTSIQSGLISRLTS